MVEVMVEVIIHEEELSSMKLSTGGGPGKIKSKGGD